MILLLSGEGTSDMGSCRNPADRCEAADFNPGPMAWIIDQLVESVWNYSPLQTACVLIPEASLARHCKEIGFPVALPGRKRPQETAYFFKNARGLARLATQCAQIEKCPVGAVLFRDSDGTHSSSTSLWNQKFVSMEAGFAADDFTFGVPMLPKPKSEAWLLCALQTNSYDHCERFENLSGNDASPNSAKKQLEATLASRQRKIDQLVEMIESGEIQATRIDMPSFNRFRTRLEEVARGMLQNKSSSSSPH